MKTIYKWAKTITDRFSTSPQNLFLSAKSISFRGGETESLSFFSMFLGVRSPIYLRLKSDVLKPAISASDWTSLEKELASKFGENHAHRPNWVMRKVNSVSYALPNNVWIGIKMGITLVGDKVLNLLHMASACSSLFYAFIATIGRYDFGISDDADYDCDL